MDPRQAEMLYGLVREYIRLAEPVSSGYLKDSLELDVSPATVRAWLKELEEAGFIEQPHTSAGRVPSDKGYRFYVEHLHRRRQEQAIAEAPHVLVRHLSRAAHALAVAGLPSGRVEQYGLLELMLQPEASSHYVIQEVSSLLDHIHDFLEELEEIASTSQASVYIGSENPHMITAHTSVLFRAVRGEDGRRALVMLIGPKRMPYSRNISLLERVSAISNSDY